MVILTIHSLKSGESRDAFFLGGTEFQSADVRCAAHWTRSIEEVQRVATYVSAGVYCRTLGIHQIKIRRIGSSDGGNLVSS